MMANEQLFGQSGESRLTWETPKIGKIHRKTDDIDVSHILES